MYLILLKLKARDSKKNETSWGTTDGLDDSTVRQLFDTKTFAETK